MSQTFSASQNSPSYDDSDTEYQPPLHRFPFPQTTPSQAPPAATSFTPAQTTDIAVAGRSDQRRSRPLDVSTILNPTPQRVHESPRRGSFGYLGSPRSRARSAGQHGPTRSLPPSPGEFSSSADCTGLREIGPRRSAPSLPAAGQPRIRHQSRSSLSDLMSSDTSNPFPLSTPRRSGPYQRDSMPSPRAHQNTAQPYSHPLVLPPASHLTQPAHGHTPNFQFPPTSSSRQYSPSYTISTPLPSADPSPTSSYAAHTPPGQPGQPPRPNAPPPFTHPSLPPGPPNQNSPNEPSYTLTGPAGSAARGTFPIVTWNTAQGTMQIPVDTTAASKIADEKRKRNAGASARFRQRRKEREREMTSRISELERRIKKTEDERDYFRSVVMQMRQRQGGPYPPLSSMSPRLPELPSLSQDPAPGHGGYGPPEGAGMDSSEGESTRDSVSGIMDEARRDRSAREAQGHRQTEQGRGEQQYPSATQGMNYEVE